jgi:hypothetical protein
MTFQIWQPPVAFIANLSIGELDETDYISNCCAFDCDERLGSFQGGSVRFEFLLGNTIKVYVRSDLINYCWV